MPLYGLLVDEREPGRAAYRRCQARHSRLFRNPLVLRMLLCSPQFIITFTDSSEGVEEVLKSVSSIDFAFRKATA